MQCCHLGLTCHGICSWVYCCCCSLSVWCGLESSVDLAKTGPGVDGACLGCDRLLGLAPEAQAQIFDLYQAVLEGSIRQARKEGKYDEGIVDVKGTAITLAQPPQVLLLFTSPPLSLPRLSCPLLPRNPLCTAQ